MKRSSLTIYLLLAVSTTMCVSVLGETDDPFAGGPKTPPVYDAAYYAKRAKEDLEGWRAYLKKIGEPDLASLKGEPGTEIYRFIFWPHFTKALVLTAKKTKGTLAFEIRRFSENAILELKGSIEIDADTFAGIRERFTKPQIYDPLRGPYRRTA